MANANESGEWNELSAAQVQSIRHELDLILSSSRFTSSKRAQEFLRLVVEHALAGEFDQLRERMIGAEMFGRPVDYDTSNDAVVRVRATEVRKRLAQYYQQAAQTSDVRIELLLGSYIPEFHWSSPTSVNEEAGITAPLRAGIPRWRRAPALAITALLVSACLFLVIWLRFPRKAQSVNTLHLSLGLPKGVTLHRNWHPFEHIAISPDGQTLAFAATDASGKSFLWIRAFSSPEAQRIEQTEGALLPFWW